LSDIEDEKKQARKHFTSEMLDKREKLEIMSLMYDREAVPDEEKAPLMKTMVLLTNLFVTADTVRELAVHSNRAHRALEVAISEEHNRRDGPVDSDDDNGTEHLGSAELNPVFMLSDVMGAMNSIIGLYREEEVLKSKLDNSDSMVNTAEDLVAHCKAKEAARKLARRQRKAQLKASASPPRSVSKKLKSKA